MPKVTAAAPPVAAPLEPEQLNERLKLLSEALDYDLGSAEALLLELGAGSSGSPLEQKIAAIAAKIEVFDIDAAKTLLAQLHDAQ